MSCRYLSAATVAAAGAVVALAPGCTATPTSTTKGTSGAPAWTQARTSWGDPDLEGVWRYEAAIALERPKALGGRALLTDEEVAERETAEQEQEANRLAGLEGTVVGRQSADVSPIIMRLPRNSTPPSRSSSRGR